MEENKKAYATGGNGTGDERLLLHEETVSFGASDFDEKGNLKASSLMYVFQEAAAAHAEALGFGFEPMMAQNYIWVLNKLRFRVDEVPKEGCRYRLKTYPRPKKGVTFFRDYYIYDEEDRLLVAGSSQWCIINFVTRKIERAKVDFDGVFIDNEAFEGGIEKFKLAEEGLALIGSHSVMEDDLDENRHVNNCRYADMVESALAGHKDFTINFLKEARLGDEILLYQEQMDGCTLVAGKLEDGVTIFQAKVL